ncbi:hypothetical protein [Scytonema sp. PRP1]|uniref:hypothetical protein n=1 Tax=Scytonema sp. PRP1 TaxID=3120513 RepID=UPI002FD756C4
MIATFLALKAITNNSLTIQNLKSKIQNGMRWALLTNISNVHYIGSKQYPPYDLWFNHRISALQSWGLELVTCGVGILPAQIM